MKNQHMKKVFLLFLTTAMMSIMTACGKTADPIILPDRAEVDSIEVENFEGEKISLSRTEEAEQMEQLLDIILEAEATNKMTIQDHPNADECGEIDIVYNDSITTVWYYQERGRYYIEQPYQGIYKTDADLEELINGLESEQRSAGTAQRIAETEQRSAGTAQK